MGASRISRGSGPRSMVSTAASAYERGEQEDRTEPPDACPHLPEANWATSAEQTIWSELHRMCASQRRWRSESRRLTRGSSKAYWPRSASRTLRPC